jgi:hypothetical protein
VPNVPQHQKLSWTDPMELQGDMGHVESRFGLFGDNVGVRCMVCAKHTVGSKIVLDAPDSTLR